MGVDCTVAFRIIAAEFRDTTKYYNYLAVDLLNTLGLGQTDVKTKTELSSSLEKKTLFSKTKLLCTFSYTITYYLPAD